MKPTVLAGLPLVTAWLTMGWWYLNLCASTSAAELVSIDVVNSARCHVRCLSLTQVNIIYACIWLTVCLLIRVNWYMTVANSKHEL